MKIQPTQPTTPNNGKKGNGVRYKVKRKPKKSNKKVDTYA